MPSTIVPQPVSQSQLKEYSFRYDGANWIQNWFQCDAPDEVMLLGSGRGKSTRFESFPKGQPSQKTVLSLSQKEEPDCGMMKCYYTFVAPGKSFQVYESHYLDDEASWNSRYTITVTRGKGRTLPEEECRWFERMRLGIVTDRRTIYVTESTSGDLQYQSFNYQKSSDTPSVTLKGGTRSVDARKGTEVYTFQSGDYSYVLNVSSTESRPFAEVLIKKSNKLVQRERILSYTFVKKT